MRCDAMPMNSADPCEPYPGEGRRAWGWRGLASHACFFPREVRKELVGVVHSAIWAQEDEGKELRRLPIGTWSHG